MDYLYSHLKGDRVRIGSYSGVPLSIPILQPLMGGVTTQQHSGVTHSHSFKTLVPVHLLQVHMYTTGVRSSIPIHKLILQPNWK